MFQVLDGIVSVSHAAMSGGKLFRNRAPAVAKARSPTVAHCDW